MRERPKAFTLIEVLVVIAIILLLAALIVPALNRSKSKARAVFCASNLRQVWMAVKAYSQDWNGFSPIWFCSGCTWSTWRDAVWQYAPNTNVFRCPLIPPKGMPPTGLAGNSYCNYGVNAYLSECIPGSSRPLNMWANPAETIALSENPDGDWVCEPRSPESPNVSCQILTPVTFRIDWGAPQCPNNTGSGPPNWGCHGRWYPHHNGSASVCFLDGHVQLMTVDEVSATVYGVVCYYWLPK